MNNNVLGKIIQNIRNHKDMNLIMWWSQTLKMGTHFKKIIRCRDRKNQDQVDQTNVPWLVVLDLTKTDPSMEVR